MELFDMEFSREDVVYMNSLISARVDELVAQGETSRNATDAAIMEFEMHMGEYPPEILPPEWKDPYADVDQRILPQKLNAKTTKAKTKK